MLTKTVFASLHEQNTYGSFEYRNMLLDEAYYGKAKVKPIQDAMDVIAKKIWKDPKWRVQDSKEAHNLEQAFCKVFGFKRCSIYWRYTDPTALNQISNIVMKGQGTDFSSGGYTTPSLVLIPDTSAKSPTNYGNNAKGFYDDSHTMVCSICMNQGYFKPLGLSSEEVVGVMLHEVGHNFDNTTFNLIRSWSAILGDVFYVADKAVAQAAKDQLNPAQLAKDAVALLAKDISYITMLKIAPEYFTIIHNIDDMLISTIPPFAQVYRGVANALGGAIALVNTATMPWFLFKYLLSLPKRLLAVPINALLSAGHWFLTNKLETYADSFAAQYGYGLEVNTGLKKIMQGAAGEFEILKKTPVDIVMRPFWDILYLTNELFSAVDGHGDNVERWKRMLATLDQDLQMSGLSAADKKLIIAERDRIKKEYEKYMKMDEDRKYIATSLYHRAVECWYRGESHGFVKTFPPSRTYAQ